MVENFTPTNPSPLASAISALQSAGFSVNVCATPGRLTVDRQELTPDEIFALASAKAGWSGPGEPGPAAS